MSDRFYPASLTTLYNMITTELDTRGSIFGIAKELFFVPSVDDPFRMRRYGQLLETPLGVAAGPHTQMAQNIVAAWLCGARYMELKTVQTLDEIEVSKPCIDIEDEGYNCEWSQELKLQESFHEYLKAWILIHVLRHKFGWDKESGELGTIFNMSVGYSLEGIMNDNVQRFLADMKDASDPLREYIRELKPLYPEVEELNIPSELSDNLTLSTMHGCPPDEIERIGLYLIQERKLHTTIKLNPTLLGPEKLRGILNDTCGFETVVPDEAFGHDLKYDDGIAILKNLIAASDKENLDFAVKLTNTLESENRRGVFNASEAMNYMSGRALHPLSISLGALLQTEFSGALDISLSGGADTFNLPSIIAANIKPVTVCSDILRPGGYGRLSQYLEDLQSAITEAGAKTIPDYVMSGTDSSLAGAGLAKLTEYAEAVVNDERYHKSSAHWPSIKSERKLELFDCIAAPCAERCPTHQDIPGYCSHTAMGNYDKALELILDSNPMPWSTGYACDHKCEDKCTRSNYDTPVHIREIKRYNAERVGRDLHHEASRENGKKVAIIGAGPSGMSAAHFLAKAGYEVTLFEQKEKPGGMLAWALPDFRLPQEALQYDVAPLERLGVTFRNGVTVDRDLFGTLTREYDYVHVAVGAQKSKALRLTDSDGIGVMGFLDFLEKVNRGELTSVPEQTVIIGGGNSAMDAARTAWRLAPESGTVAMVYRRMEKQMPADWEEIEALKEEGIPVYELLSPKRTVLTDGALTALECEVMKLGEPDASGRARPVATGEIKSIPAKLVIVAIGQDSDVDFLEGSSVETTQWGTVIVENDTHRTTVEKVFSGGDVAGGPDSIIRAIADGKEAAWTIMDMDGISHAVLTEEEREPHGKDLRLHRARRDHGPAIPMSPLSDRKNFNMVIESYTEEEIRKEAARCLACDLLCEVCVTVCPNRANLSWYAPPMKFNIRDITLSDGTLSYGVPSQFEVTQAPQVLNIGDFCNECGNCTTFCPTSGRPFKDKAKFYIDYKGFEEESDSVWYISRKDEKHTLLHKEEGLIYSLAGTPNDPHFHLTVEGATLELTREDLSIARVETGDENLTIDMRRVAGMATYLESSLLNMLGL